MKSRFSTTKFFHFHHVFNVIATLFATLVLAGILTPVASAASGPTFSVMNTSETPPDGVWFRNSPHTADTDRVTGHGVYAGDSVQLVCYQFGDAVGSYNNTLWYYVTNLTRPTVQSTGTPNVGYLNAHYINDGMPANQKDANVLACGASQLQPAGSVSQLQPAAPASQLQPAAPASQLPSASLPAIPGGASVYYSPFTSNYIYGNDPDDTYSETVTPVASKTLYLQEWHDQSWLNKALSVINKSTCSTAKVSATPNIVNGTVVTTLSGWSLGRMGPIYYLKAYPDRAKQIHYIVLFDPGNLKDLKGDCYSNQISSLLKTWLNYDPSNKLVIMAGKVTRDWNTRVIVNGQPYAHQGLQQVYFPQLRAPQISRRVTVCNYDDMRHEVVWTNFQNVVNQSPIQNTCPPAPGTRSGPVPWHP